MSTTTTTPVKKFVLKFELNSTRPSVVCESTGFYSELIGDYKFSNVAHVKNLLIKHFIAREEATADTTQKFLVYNVKAKNTNTATVYRAPRVIFWPNKGDFETMQIALTAAKVPVSFFDDQIKKHLTYAGIPTTRENVRIYRASYKDQLSKLLLSEILSKRTIVSVTRWFDKINGNSHSSVSIFDGRYQINVPLSYGYGSAENIIIHALKLDVPYTMCSWEYLESLGMTVVDLGYGLKREMFQAAFYI